MIPYLLAAVGGYLLGIAKETTKYAKGGSINDSLWESVKNKFSEVFFEEDEGDEIYSNQVKAEEYKWQFDRYSKYASSLSWEDAKSKFLGMLTDEEKKIISIEYNVRDVHELFGVMSSKKIVVKKLEFAKGGKFSEGGVAGAKEYQIKKTDGTYFYLKMSTGNAGWAESADMGYQYTQEEAERIKAMLEKEGYSGLSVVKYDKDWWKNAPDEFSDGGSIQFEGRFQKDLEKLLENEGWSVNYYDKNINEVPKNEAYQMSVYTFDPFYQNVTIKLPTKKVTLDWVMNKINTDKVYKSFAENFNKLLKSKGYEDINAYPTTYGIGTFVAFGKGIEETKSRIENLLKSLGIEFTTEYSDAHYVFRYKISKSKDNIEKIDNFSKKFAKGGKVKKKYAVLRSTMGEIIADIEVQNEDKMDALKKFRDMGINEVGTIYFTDRPPHYYAKGGEIKWQDIEVGDSARVKDINKTGVVVKTYGRKFHLKFVDGTEKTYDANELDFFKN